MAHEIRSEVEIDAPATSVWKKLVSFRHYPDWNPLISHAEGDIEKGAKLKVTLSPPGADPHTIEPEVTEVVGEQELRWIFRKGLPGILDIEHAFLIEPLPGAKTQFQQVSKISGLMSGGLVKKFAPALREGMEKMNAALKARAEADPTN